ncbi:hypothetical protein ACFSKN_16820 [Mariniflexile gromovii]|uniref:Outer membrane protein with beta-barrel domain n=1 Tax=Mariniflexile gromovii TaxID=362523 RepID=A0ABS4BYT5_9FLAO|nr:hypothetical protein [Mariniflexile gromovii]MBP0905563.1 hypothetical protein [Mariniflexile gromovii]
MKKITLCLVFAIVGFINLNAQEFRLGVSGGVPLSVSNEYSAALDISYLLNITDKFDVGLTTGLSYWFKRPEFYSGSVKFLETEEIPLIPIALTTRFNVFKSFDLGLDLGYAIPMESEMYQSGFYFAPKVQYGISKSTDIVLGYRAAKLESDLNNSTVDMLTLGIEFKL